MNMGRTTYDVANVYALKHVNVLNILLVESSGLTVDPLVRMS